jgi:hypothetical protein
MGAAILNYLLLGPYHTQVALVDRTPLIGAACIAAAYLPW